MTAIFHTGHSTIQARQPVSRNGAGPHRGAVEAAKPRQRAVLELAVEKSGWGSALPARRGRVVQCNFHDYPLLKMDETPEIETWIVQSDAAPAGIRETGNPPITAAVANAVYAAIGKRVRRLPILPEDVLAA